MVWTIVVLCAVPVLIALFFFCVTRAALLLRQVFPSANPTTSHIYPVYSNPLLIKLVDCQPLISAILLFQYEKIVDDIVAQIRQMDLRNKKLLITSCAFGNMIPRVVQAAVEAGVERVIIVDLIAHELRHAQHKLAGYDDKIVYLVGDAAAMQLQESDIAVNVIFFLLHELPHPLKSQVLREAGRMLAPGGTLLLAEFHRPNSRILRVLSACYFTVFEPLGLALWSDHDPVVCLSQLGNWQCARQTYASDNFQLIRAIKSIQP